MSAAIEISAVCPVQNHIRLASDFSTTTTGNVNVTGMVFLLDENSFYEITCYALLSSNATTTGFILGGTAPTGSTMYLTAVSQSSANGTGDVRFTNGTTSVTMTTPANFASTTPQLAILTFIVFTGAESSSPTTGIVGSFQLTFGSETGGNVTMSAGSAMVLRKMTQAVSTAALTLQNPGLDASYSSTDRVVGPSASATITLTYLANGTWTIAGETDDAFLGTTTSGNWGTPTTAGAGSNYEVRFTVSGQVGGTVSNSAADWTPISESRKLIFSISSTGGEQTGTLTATLEVRQRGSMVVGSTDSVDLAVVADAES